MNKRRVLGGLIATAAIVCTIPALGSENIVVVRAHEVYTATGEVLEDGMILIRDGRIAAIGSDIAIPDGARLIELQEGSVTPGLIDANALLEPADVVSQPSSRRRGILAPMFDHSNTAGEQAYPCAMCDGTEVCALANLHEELKPGEICPVCGGTLDQLQGHLAPGVALSRTRTEAAAEVVPHTRVVDSINFDSPDFDRLLRGGVSTVFASSDSAAVIGPRGSVVRTGGPFSKRIVMDAADVQATMGSDPYAVGGRNGTPNRRSVTSRTRRPQSRMGVAFVFRKAFYDAEKHSMGEQVFGTDIAPDEALEVVEEIREGSVPLRVQARTQNDIRTAMRLCDEFELPFTLLEATEAYACIDELKERDLRVIFGPIFIDPSGARAMTGEANESRLTTVRDLRDAGIEFAISAQDLREEDGLARQAMYAMRAGLTREEALEAVSAVPARMLGVDEQIGTLEVGKRGDLVLWSGKPFDATSRPVVVILDGAVAFDGR